MRLGDHRVERFAKTLAGDRLDRLLEEHVADIRIQPALVRLEGEIFCTSAGDEFRFARRPIGMCPDGLVILGQRAVVGHATGMPQELADRHPCCKGGIGPIVGELGIKSELALLGEFNDESRDEGLGQAVDQIARRFGVGLAERPCACEAIPMLGAADGDGHATVRCRHRQPDCRRQHESRDVVAHRFLHRGPAFSPAGRSIAPSASARRAAAEPGLSGLGWLSCGAQAVIVTKWKVAGTRPSSPL